MDTFHSRPYLAADLPALIQLCKTRPPNRLTEFPSITDLEELFSMAPIRQNARLWETAGGCLAGWATLDFDSGHLISEVAPSAAPPAVSPGSDCLDADILEWALARVTLKVQAEGIPLSLTAGCRDDDTARLAILEQYGLKPQADRAVQLVRSLAAPIPEPPLAPGFTIQHGVPEDRAPAWVALHRAAHGTNIMTVEYRLAMQYAPHYDPDLDLVAVAPDGSLSAYCMCYISAEENEMTGRKDGYTDPIATHPAYQRRGLGRALLLTGLALLRARGMEYGHTSTDSSNTGLLELARAVGFQVESTRLFLTRPVYAPQEAPRPLPVGSPVAVSVAA